MCLKGCHYSVKQFGSRSGPTFVGPDNGPNSLQRLSADDTSKQRVKVGVVFRKVQLPQDVASLFVTLVMH